MSNLHTFTLPESVRSFRDYFRVASSTSSVVRALGYAYETSSLPLDGGGDVPDWAAQLKKDIAVYAAVVNLESETARREALVAPILLGLMLHYHLELKIEFPIDATPQLRGKLDYLMLTPFPLLVVEAKMGDTVRGFTQLAAEMIALDKIADDSMPIIYGAVTTGTIWQFAVLNRAEKRLIQDANYYTVPGQMDSLIRVLIGILTKEPGSAV